MRHSPILTFDVDLWINDDAQNCQRCEPALAALDADRGATDADWGPIGKKPAGWLSTQAAIEV